jgi:hypothetical protein
MKPGERVRLIKDAASEEMLLVDPKDIFGIMSGH